jgi:hypothetical protein
MSSRRKGLMPMSKPLASPPFFGVITRRTNGLPRSEYFDHPLSIFAFAMPCSLIDRR